MSKTNPKAPNHLSIPMRRWWTAVMREFDLDPQDVKLVTLAAEAHDRCTDARETIANAGTPYYTNRFGEPRAHPAVAIERDSRTSFARLLRELGLDAEPLSDDARLPRARGTK